MNPQSNHFNVHHLLLCLFCSLFLLGVFATHASAQYGGGGMGRKGMGSGNGSPQTSRSDPQNDCTLGQTNADAVPQDLVESRLAMLEPDLKLEAAQYTMWEAFRQKVNAYALEVARQRTPSASSLATNYQETNGLKYVSQTVDRARNRYNLLEEIESRTKALYKVMNTEQKTLLDMRMPTIVAPRFVNPKCHQLGY
jgi:hypothetical protein